MAKAKKAAKKTAAKKANTKPVNKAVAKKPAPKITKPAQKAAKKPAPTPVKKATKKVAAVAKEVVKEVKALAKKMTAAPATVNKATKTAAPAAKAKGSSVPDLSNFVTPLDDRVVIQVSGTERKTAGGLFIPDTVSDVSGNLEGQVVVVGRGHRDAKGRLRPMDVRPGDRVVFNQHAGSKIKLRDLEFIILRESELMGVIA